MNLQTPIQQITGIGPVFQRKLKKLGVKTVNDLLLHFPHRYEDFSKIVPIAKVKAGESCSIRGKILKIQSSRTWKKKLSITQAIIEDQSGAIEAIWFNQPYLIKTLKQGENLILSGRADWNKNGFSLNNPVYEKISGEESFSPTHAGGIIPIYPETEGLSSRWLRYMLKPLLKELAGKMTDPLPKELATQNNLISLPEAIWQIHFPDSFKKAELAKERFSFQNIFFIELWVTRERMRLAKEKATAVPMNLELIKRLVDSLPFKLTDSQRKSAWQILKDVEKSRPMNRLLEGDVGSGKTIVAALAIINVVKAGHQAVLMAPTEILAKQHFKTIWDLLNRFRIDVGLLTGKSDRFYSHKLKNQEIEISRKKLLERAKNNEIPLIIGTHALIQDKVKFGKLALVVLDEQHRFGVEQRAKLLHNSKQAIPHLLSMTATPIPRTLALTIYGDLDLSLIEELPSGRKKIITKIISLKERKSAYELIRREIKKGRQAFVICPRIEEEGKMEIKSVKQEYENLSKKIFPDLKVAMLHGKMPSNEKERTMRDFKNKKSDILVSTSVVEVGVDIPNATVMAIEGSDRFGLAQLHQFRGRVGRAKYQSYCLLFMDSENQKTSRRLKALIESENGFKLAEKDLEIRGPGDFIGKRQWGIPDMVMESLVKNMPLVEKTKQAAKEILEKDPLLKNYPILKEKLNEFGERIHWE
jgi:ATP-dependent DNA helicase RecG